jgi:hypothetical protein
LLDEAFGAGAVDFEAIDEADGEVAAGIREQVDAS